MRIALAVCIATFVSFVSAVPASANDRPSIEELEELLIQLSVEANSDNQRSSEFDELTEYYKDFDASISHGNGNGETSVSLEAEVGTKIKWQSIDEVDPKSVNFHSEETDDGAARTLISISSATSPKEYKFDLDLPVGAKAEVVDSGEVLVTDSSGYPLGVFEAPWAHDANNTAINTWFEVHNSVLIQHVDFSADNAFPVTADPKWTWGIVSGTVYFNRSETRKVAASVSAGAALSPFIHAIPPGTIPTAVFKALAVWIYTAFATISAWAVSAHAQKKCLKLKYGGTGSIGTGAVGYSAGHYTGGYCK